MDLFRLEHTKLWRKPSVRVSVFLCFAYMVILGGILSFQWFNFGSMDGYTTAFGNHFDGYSMIKGSQEYALSFEGELTDETLQQMVRDYQRMKAAGMDEELQKTDYQTINSWLMLLWPELYNSADYRSMINYVDPGRLTGLYERRTQAIEDFLENSNQVGAERDYLLRMDEKVDKPLHYAWTQGWSIQLGSTLADMGTVMALFIAIALSSMFAGEWHDNTSSLVLTTRNGWKEIAKIKIYTGVVFAVELSMLLILGTMITQVFYMGMAGWNMPIQNVKMLAIAPMNVLQAEMYEFAVVLLGAVGYAGIVMLISAATKSNVLALLFSLAVVYGPPTIASYLPYEVQKAIDLIPLVGSGADIFRTNTLTIFGKIIWSPYLLITVPILIGLVCMPFAIMKWSKRLKA